MVIEIIFYFTLLFAITTTIISIINLFTAPRIKLVRNKLISHPLISILIPARDEEQNIENCISNVLKQTYQNYELLVLDDESEDETANIVNNKISNLKVKSNIRLISGKPIPAGWLGKNWACHQLSLEARGKYLLFMDADVTIIPEVLEACIFFLNKYQLQLITCFPTQKMKSYGEWMIVPMMNFLLLTFLPLKKVYTSKKRSLIAANGQFLLIKKAVYDEIGGHKSVANKVVEDMEIARKVKTNGYRLMTFLGDNLITCRMYSSFNLAFSGFSKNFFIGFNTPMLIFISFLVFLFITFFLPFLMIFMNSIFLWVVLLILLGKLSTSLSSRQNLLVNILFHPVQIIIMLAIGINSVFMTKKKKLKWKGRFI